MSNHAVTAAGEAMSAAGILGRLTELLKAGDAQGALALIEASAEEPAEVRVSEKSGQDFR